MTFKVNVPDNLNDIIKKTKVIAMKYGIRCQLGEKCGNGSWMMLKANYEVIGDSILFTLNKRPFGVSRDSVIAAVTNFINS